MADLTEAYSALQKADAAGDTAGAKQLADYIRSQQATPQAPQAQQPQTGYGMTDFLKDFASAAVRPAVKAVTGIPGMAADSTVALANILRGQVNLKGEPGPGAWQLPTQATNQLLDQYTRPPTGIGKAAEAVNTMLLSSRIPNPQFGPQAPEGFADPGQAMHNATLQRAQAEGYVVPPSTNNPSFMNKLLEGISGKVKLQQEAAARNQPVTDMLAARALGQNPDMPLTQGALSSIRAEASQAGYAPLRELGEIPTDPRFTSDLQGLTQSAQGAARSFPGIQPQSPINGVVEALSQPSFHSSDGIDAISVLRSQADDAFRSGNGTLGRQFKQAAQAVEDQIERHLESTGDTDMLNSFRDARQQIAQTYTAGKAIVGDTGSSNALKYAQALAANKPLVGDQRTIGAFASQFKKAAAFQTESFPSISPLDAYGSAIAAGASGSAAPLLVPLSRVGIREYLLSPAGQARAIPQAFKTPETLGAMGGLPSLVQSFFAQ